MALNLLAAAFAVFMLFRHGRRALLFLSRGVDPAERRRVFPSFFTAAVAALLLLASLNFALRSRPGP